MTERGEELRRLLLLAGAVAELVDGEHREAIERPVRRWLRVAFEDVHLYDADGLRGVSYALLAEARTFAERAGRQERFLKFVSPLEGGEA